jgi:hypothetical protein
LRLTLMISDSGTGMDPELVRPGTGLVGMRARMRAVRAEIAVSSRPGDGVLIRVQVPFVTAHMQRKIRILLADDHAVVRQGFRLILNQEPDMEVIGEAGDGAEAVRLVLQHRPTLAIMDIAMPRINGVEATRRIIEG